MVPYAMRCGVAMERRGVSASFVGESELLIVNLEAVKQIYPLIKAGGESDVKVPLITD